MTGFHRLLPVPVTCINVWQVHISSGPSTQGHSSDTAAYPCVAWFAVINQRDMAKEAEFAFNEH